MLTLTIPAMIAFYTFVEQTILAKAYICMTLTIMSFITCIINREIVLTQPYLSGVGVLLTNNLLRSYFVIDTIYHIYKNRWNSRKDLLFHHIITLIPFLFIPKCIGITFPIMSEIYSTGAIFKLNPNQDLKYRAFMILTVRLFIWTTLFRMSFIDGQEFIHIFFEKIVSIGMVCLDAYWLKLIYNKMKNTSMSKSL
jgi:hypothetical protein